MLSAPSTIASSSEAIDFERQIAEWRCSAIDSLPPRIRKLSAIVRRSVATGRLGALRRWCKQNGLRVSRHQLRAFRDFLATRLLNLADLEPAARARLRTAALRGQDLVQMTDDYRQDSARGEDLRCRDCRYFVTAPGDSDPRDPNHAKSCVELGTKGADQACVGFVRGVSAGAS